MKEDVLFIFNEAEEQKMALLSEVILAVQSLGLCCSLISPTEDLIETIQLRKPRCIVIDYFLGVAGTAIEIIDQLKKQKNIIVWSDENSIEIVVSLMKKGISNYLEFSKEKLPILTENITSIVNTKSKKKNNKIDQKYIFHSKRSKLLLKQINSNNSSLSLLIGPPGSGRNTIAKLMHQSKPLFGTFKEIDIDLMTKNILDFFKSVTDGTITLPNNSTIFLDHIEFSNEELISSISQFALEDFQVILGTSDIQYAKALNRIEKIHTIEIPSLIEREEDISLLINSFKSVSSDTLKLLNENILQKDWPGNLKQLNAVVTNIDVFENESESDISDYINFLKNTWEKYNTLDLKHPEKTTAIKTYLNSNKNISVTAAKLGTSVQQLMEAISGTRN